MPVLDPILLIIFYWSLVPALQALLHNALPPINETDDQFKIINRIISNIESCDIFVTQIGDSNF